MTTQDSLQGTFDNKIFVTSGNNTTKTSGASYAPVLNVEEGEGDHENSEISDIATGTDNNSNNTNNTSHLNVSYGRPDYSNELKDMAIWGSDAIVFACGPTALAESCSDTALKYGISFHSETFEF